ncbi:hypothetical protein KO481_23070 [Nocardia sp. NEAU-G5]|uniref:Spore-associated protein A n=1 Tax=Nocardia albiluteola TaxID=2842303 RepID=A0ABS6B276_9NOCA|nr:hypothetical protein [Nocardia albiluteola]MBU3064402.1 hypothetical protein [Nocardia albiluteola]
MIEAKRIAAACAGAIGIVAATAALVPATASAAAYGNQCGNGYNVIDSHPLRGGTVYLTYNGEKNCVVTIRDDRGANIDMAAGVELSKNHRDFAQDKKPYTWYAGPVYLQAAHQCIDWGGLIGGTDNMWIGRNVHCG